MNIKQVGTYLLGGLMATSVTGCKQSFKEVKNVEPQLEKRINAIAKRTADVLDDKTYTLYGRDTLRLNNKFKASSNKFIEEINDSAASKAPARIIDSKLVVTNTPIGPMVKNHVIKEPVYKDTKAVIVPNKVFTDGWSYYVPVEYYGK